MLTAAISASPTYAEAYNNLGVLQRDVGAVKVERLFQFPSIPCTATSNLRFSSACRTRSPPTESAWS